MGCNCNCEEMKQYWVGQDLKFLLEIKTEEGSFDMDDDYYEMVLRCGGVTQEKTKADISVEGQDHILGIDTTGFPSGVLQLLVTAHVNDSSFPDDERTENYVLNLCELKKM